MLKNKQNTGDQKSNVPLAFHPQTQNSPYIEIISPSDVFRFGFLTQWSKWLFHRSCPQCTISVNDLVSEFLLYFERTGDIGLRVWESILLTSVWLLSCCVAFSCLSLLPTKWDSATNCFSLPRSLTTSTLLYHLLNKHHKKERDTTPNAIFIASFSIIY